MDDIVIQALAKWPNVPHCYGWLGLDTRGQWYLRDAAAQAAGGFAQSAPSSPARGTRLAHEKFIAFIQRNYAHDAAGQWFFQNGPQRVYVELALTPLVWRVADDFSVSAHTGQPARPGACLLDEAGRLYLASDLGLGLVHTQDMGRAAEAIEQGRWVPEAVRADELPARFGYVISPELLSKE